ncbi:redoxin domain-containing protein [Chloroflexota bacterium]
MGILAQWNRRGKSGISLRRDLSRYSQLALGLLVVILLGMLVIQGCTSGAQSTIKELPSGTTAPGALTPAPEVGYLAPDFTLVDLKGNQVTLSDLRGEAVFLNFWATWCPPCRAEMPEMEAVYQKYKDKGVVVIGVDILEPEDVVRQYVGQGGYSWIFLIDTLGAVSANYKILTIPTSFFIDREGVIQVVTIGAMTKQTMETNLAVVMK